MVILKLQGSKPELKSLMLYSHIDVVPTFKVGLPFSGPHWIRNMIVLGSMEARPIFRPQR